MIDKRSGIVYHTNMSRPQIVIDTNVMVAGLRSRRGAAFQLLQLVSKGFFDIHLSVPIVMEYESVLHREQPHLTVTASVIDDVIDYHCAVAQLHPIFFLWRPFLPDPKDDMVLELAIAAQCDFIVTYNVRDFRGAEQFRIQVVRPRDLLLRLE
jgi:putative PIN family toxin of toxin-antitoxin system